ncbi:MAG: hypothetical protein LRZ84_14585 [Desertifilum sp.]|nr:hypothetical protein [Desertifilum sp.]
MAKNNAPQTEVNLDEMSADEIMAMFDLGSSPDRISFNDNVLPIRSDRRGGQGQWFMGTTPFGKTAKMLFIKKSVFFGIMPWEFPTQENGVTKLPEKRLYMQLFFVPIGGELFEKTGKALCVTYFPMTGSVKAPGIDLSNKLAILLTKGQHPALFEWTATFASTTSKQSGAEYFTINWEYTPIENPANNQDMRDIALYIRSGGLEALSDPSVTSKLLLWDGCPAEVKALAEASPATQKFTVEEIQELSEMRSMALSGSNSPALSAG